MRVRAQHTSPVLRDDSLVAWCLSQGPDPNATCPSNRTVFHCATSFRTFASLCLLIDSGGSFTYQSPLKDIVACAVLRQTKPGSRLPTIPFLIELGANLSARYRARGTRLAGLEDFLGQSAASHVTVMYNCPEIVELLVRGDADVRQKVKNVFAKEELLEFRWLLEFLDNFEADVDRK
ncbi:hypothetical protein BU23DRAFT_658910 [Bimuria novae-zelandiae CBS 107.79]|uniref:Ankyrin n=1 Tax=Bimuria novae-zelandiae CBS 107.79 TaxID=1447943 RepID=A0A6A5UQP0_9PLEO|nr:hypothetical protein BU23DRAFT_658910 [Bimuria novae-zelandiae CBS 107.79]